MTWKNGFAALIASCFFLLPAAHGDEIDEARLQFEGIIKSLNENSFDRFLRAVDKNELTTRIYANRIIEPQVKKAFSSDFNGSLQQMYVSSFPKSKKEILGKVIEFQAEGARARAVVRFVSSGYRYSYHVYDLAIDGKGRPVILDWLDYYQGAWFSDEAGRALVMAMPGKPATRNMLTNKDVGEGEIFQMGELFKAVRDDQGERFFQIYDGLDEALKAEPIAVRLYFQLSILMRDNIRSEAAVARLFDTFPDDGLYSLRLLEFYLPTRQYGKAIAGLARLQEVLGVEEGAIDSLKASAALANGDLEDAEKYAQAAIAAEPSLEVAWWSLLRVRTRAQDYEGATEALARLEDDFGHTLDATKLKKDRYLKVLADQQAFIDWRAARD